MTQPHDDDHAFARWNEEMVHRYDIERYYQQSHALVRWLERKRLSRLHALAAPAGGDSVLEVGCGAGHVLERFPGLRRTGIDLSPTMLGRSARRLGTDVELLQGSAEELPFDDGSFDIVLCTEVLEHTRDPRRVIAELLRVARPSARVVVSIPNERNIDRAKRAIRALPGVRTLLKTLAEEGNEWHLHQFDEAQLRRICEGITEIAVLKGIPYDILPVRLVALLRPAGALRT